MIVSLLRRDQALRVLPFLWVCFAVLGWFMADAANESFAANGGARAPDREGLLVQLTFLAIWTLANYFFVGRMHEIATPFHIALPIDARALWTARMISLLLLVPGALVCLSAAFWGAYDHPLQPFHWNLGINALSFAVLMPFLYRSVRIEKALWGLPIPLFLTLTAGFLWLLAAAESRGPTFGAIAMAAAVVLAATTYLRTPRSFELPVGEAASDRWRDHGRTDRPRSDRRWSHRGWSDLASAVFAGGDRLPGLGWLVRRDRILRPPAWMVRGQLMLLLSLMVVLNVFALSVRPYVLVLAVVVLQLMWFFRGVNGAARIAHLPVQLDVAFRYATVPPVALFALAFAIWVGLHPDLTWGGILTDPRYAWATLMWVVSWWFVLSLGLVGLETPPTRRWWIKRLARVRYGVALLVVAALLAFELEQGLPWENVGEPGVLELLAQRTPLGAWAVWLLAAGAAAALYPLLRREFSRAELALLLKAAPYQR